MIGQSLVRCRTSRACDVLARLDALPFCDLDAFEPPFLVVTPHPDDESLGCGGLIAAARQHAIDVDIVLLSDGAASHPSVRRDKLVPIRAAELRAAAGQLGVAGDRVHELGLPDGRLPRFGPALSRAAAALEGPVRAASARTLFTTWPHDPHRDHLAAFRIARRAARATGAALFAFPVWGWTLAPGARVSEAPIDGLRFDVSRHLSDKRAAIDMHRSQTGALDLGDPAAFRLTDAFRRWFERPYEVFVRA